MDDEEGEAGTGDFPQANADPAHSGGPCCECWRSNPSRPVPFILVDPGSRLQLLGISKLSVEVNKSEILQYDISVKSDV